MEAGNERLFRVLGDVGSDLIATAEQKVFTRSPWRRIMPAVACLLVVVGLSLAAAPRFLVQQPGSAAPTAAPEAAVEEAAPVENQSVPADQIAADQSETEGQTAELVEPVVSGQQLVFWETVYYVEAQYTLDEAEPLLGAGLGAVEAADTEAWVGAAVYTKQNAETKSDYKERLVPLEIFVEVEDGYLYCLTYYLSDKPLMEWEGVYSRWHAGKLDELVHIFVEPIEMSACNVEYPLYTGETLLTPEQQLQLFLALLEMEQQSGTRTAYLNSYLWQTESGYIIPVEDIREQLSRYLDDFNWQPELLPGYDSDLNAVIMENLSSETDAEDQPYTYLQIEPNGCALDEERRSLTLTVQRFDSEEMITERLYVIRFDPDRIVYSEMDTVDLE